MKCSYCGYENEDGVKYCVECGGYITTKIVKKTEEKIDDSFSISEVSSPIEKKESGKLAIVSIVFACLGFNIIALIMAACGFYIYKSQKNINRCKVVFLIVGIYFVIALFAYLLFLLVIFVFKIA